MIFNIFQRECFVVITLGFFYLITKLIWITTIVEVLKTENKKFQDILIKIAVYSDLSKNIKYFSVFTLYKIKKTNFFFVPENEKLLYLDRCNRLLKDKNIEIKALAHNKLFLLLFYYHYFLDFILYLNYSRNNDSYNKQNNIKTN